MFTVIFGLFSTIIYQYVVDINIAPRYQRMNMQLIPKYLFYFCNKSLVSVEILQQIFLPLQPQISAHIRYKIYHLTLTLNGAR